MIEIQDPPTSRCDCPPPLVWLWSPRRESWVSFEPAGEMYAIRPHRCEGDTSRSRASWLSLLPRPDQRYINERGRALAEVILRQNAQRTEDTPEAS